MDFASDVCKDDQVLSNFTYSRLHIVVIMKILATKIPKYEVELVFLCDLLWSEIKWVDISVLLPPLEQLQMKHGLCHGEDAAEYWQTWRAWGQPGGTTLTREPGHKQYHEYRDEDCTQLHGWPNRRYIQPQWELCRQTKFFVCSLMHIPAIMLWCDRTEIDPMGATLSQCRPSSGISCNIYSGIPAT